MRPEPVLVITDRTPAVIPGQNISRCVCVDHEWRSENRRLVSIFEVEDDNGDRGTIRKWLTVRKRLSSNSKLSQLYSQILNRPLEICDQLDPREFHCCVFLVTVGWKSDKQAQEIEAKLLAWSRPHVA